MLVNAIGCAKQFGFQMATDTGWWRRVTNDCW